MTKLKNFLFQNSSTKQTVIKNTIWLSIGQILGRLTRVIIIIYAARVLGAASWGAFSYALSVAAFLSIFADLGINGLITRETAKGTNNFISTGLIVKAVVIISLLIIVPFIAPYITSISEAAVLIPIAVLVFAFDSIRDFGSALARAHQKMEIESITNIITNIAIVAVGSAFLFNFGTSQSLVWGYALGAFIGALLMLYLSFKYLKDIKWGTSFKNIKNLLSKSLPFAVVTIMGAVMINTDIITLGWLTDATQTGIYSAAQRPVQILYVFPALIATSLFPLITKISTDVKKLRHTLEKGLSFLMLLAFPIAIGGFLLGTEITTFLFGQNYIEGGLSFSILSLASIFVFPSILLGNTIFAIGHEKKLIAYSLVGMIGNFLLNIFLIPIYGILGCALATLIIQALINSYLIIKMKGIISYSIFPKIKKALVASAILALFIIYLPTPHIVLTIALGALIYGITLLILREPLLKLK